MTSRFSVMVVMTMLRSCGKKERLLGFTLLNLQVKHFSIVGFGGIDRRRKGAYLKNVVFTRLYKPCRPKELVFS